MQELRIIGIPSKTARAYQRGALDAYGQSPLVWTATEPGFPCRHCLDEIEVGAQYLVLAHRPFTGVHAYTETGPIFLHARQCPAYQDGDGLPGILEGRPEVLMRAYDDKERIVYGTGAVVRTSSVRKKAEALLRSEAVAFVDVRSSTNNCFLCRVERIRNDAD